MGKIVSRSQEVLLENYGRVPLAMVRGSGSLIYDEDGNEYIDLFAGFGACGLLGHANELVAEAVSRQSKTLLAHGNLFTSEPQVALAEKLLNHSIGKGKVFFCHSGAEADEAALKLCRKAAGSGRYKILCFDGCFHGRTMGGLSLCPEVFQQGFQPMLEGVVRIPFNDIEAFDKAFDDSIAGVFVEPIQGEGGLNVPDVEFMKHLRKRCTEKNALLVCDEVWTGPARTGKWFAYQYFGIEPDVITVAKALGGGLPVAACIISEKWKDVLGPGTHGCTMGGNPICAAGGLAAVSYVEENNLVDHVAKRGSSLVSYLREQLGDAVIDVRGRGFMLGIQLPESISASEVVKACRENQDCRVIVCSAKNNVVRIAPGMNIPEELLEKGIGVLINKIK